jgi:hypothetical protein
MFFSAKELHSYVNRGDLQEWQLAGLRRNIGDYTSLKAVSAYLKVVKDNIVERRSTAIINGSMEYLSKWYRPWDVVPSLANIRAPEGDYLVGVEVERGFTSREAAQSIVEKIKNWKHIAVDIEGGTTPIEATFPPFLYSKMNSRRQVFRYLKLLRENENLLVQHTNRSVGMHINVSKGGVTFHDSYRAGQVSEVIENELGCADYTKYFDRRPYGFCYVQQTDTNSYIEYKLFNSVTSNRKLRRFINTAVALTDLITGTEYINESSVRAALEIGYNK